MPSTTNKGYTTPLFNTEVGTWGNDIVTNFTSIVDLNVGGQTNIGLSSTNVTLTTGSSGQMQNAIITLTGLLLANVTVYSSCVGFCIVENNTSGAFTVTYQANFGSGGVGSASVLSQGNKALIASDPTNGARIVSSSVTTPSGSLTAFAGATAPSGWLLCFGQVVSQSTYPNLYAAILTAYNTGGEGAGNFRLPDLRGRSIFGLDNMGGIAAGRLTGADTGNISSPTTLGGAGGEENHTLLTAELASHTHTVTDPGHSHSTSALDLFATVGSGSTLGNLAQNPINNTTTGTTTTAISINASGSGNSHNTTPPAMVMNWIIKI